MSNLVVPDVGKIRVLWQMLGLIAFVPTRVHLYQNNYTPDHTTTTGAMTEATYSGYAFAALSGGTVSGTLDGTGRAVATYDAVTFTKSGATGNSIYGYYVTDASNNLLWAERFDAAPIPLTVDGSFIQMFPKCTLKSQFSNT